MLHRRFASLGRERASWLALSVFLIAGTVACTDSHGLDTTGPSTPTGTSASVAGGGLSMPMATVRFYASSITTLPNPPGGTTVQAGTTRNYSLTITNCNGNNGTVPCGAAVTSAHQAIGSATVAVQPGFTVNAASLLLAGAVTATGGKAWTATLSAGVLTLQASGGTNKLDVGESVTVKFEATAPCSAQTPNTWTTAAYQDTPLATTTPYSLVGSDPSITVTGTCAVACTRGQGFWKNTPGAWAVTTLTLGTVSYSQAQLLQILNEPVVGNGLVSLAHQLIAAKLNVAAGTDPSAVSSSISAADTMIGGLIVPPIGSGSLATSATSALATALDNYNSGITGPGACPSN